LGSHLGADFRRGIALSLPLLIWPFLARPSVVFLIGTLVLVLLLLILARTATQLIVVLFAYFAVDGYLRLLFNYSWVIYLLPFLASIFVYLRWFTSPRWRQSSGAFFGNPISIPLLGLVGLYLLQMFNGVPFNPVVSLGGLAYHLGAVPLFFIAATGFADVRKIRNILWFIVALAALESAYALVQYYFGAPGPLALSQAYQVRIAREAWWIPGSAELIYRPTGLTLTGGGPGLYGLVGFVLTLGLLRGQRSSMGIRLLVVAGMFVMMVAVFLSAVRAFWLSLLIALIAFSMLQNVRYLTLSTGLVWGAAALAIRWTRGALFQRLSTLSRPWELFSRERGGDVLSLPTIIAQHPFGIGLGRVAGAAAGRAAELFPEGAYGMAHNYWLSLTWEASIIAPLLLFWLLWKLASFGFSLWRRVNEPGLRSIIAAILGLDLGITAMTFAGPSLAGLASTFAQYFWFLSGLLFAVARVSDRAPESAPTTRDSAVGHVRPTRFPPRLT
jgi:hypothetical protein